MDAGKAVGHPGSIAYAAKHGHYAGCKMEVFESTTDLNKFFEENKGFLVVDIIPRANGQLVVLYNKALNDEEMEMLTQYQSDWEEFREQKMASRREADALEKAAEKKLETEKLELQELGRKCRDNHAAVIEDNQKLKAELKKAKRGK